VYFMSTACGRPQGEGVWLMWTKGGKKSDFFCGRHKWMAPYNDGEGSSCI